MAEDWVPIDVSGTKARLDLERQIVKEMMVKAARRAAKKVVHEWTTGKVRPMKKSERDELPPARQPDAVSTYESEVARGTAREKAKADRRAEALRRLEAELTQMEDLEAEHDADPVALPEGALIAGVAKPTRSKAAKHK